LFEVAGAEIGGEEAEAAFAPEVDLPEAVAGGVEALDEEEVGAIFGADMGDAPAVDVDGGGGGEAG